MIKLFVLFILMAVGAYSGVYLKDENLMDVREVIDNIFPVDFDVNESASDILNSLH